MSSKKKTVSVDLGLSDEDKKELHRMARSVIESCATTGFRQAPAAPTSEKLKQQGAAFVCIYKQGMLRGCIGSLEAKQPLHKCVQEMAYEAANCDPRFRPVTEDELPYLDLEISVLTPMVEIEDPEEIEVNRHGIFIRKGRCSGVLLPQVAAERGWDRVKFLQETCRKAGLRGDAWKEEDAKIYVFSADVF